jgi:hypothetical protein
MGQRQAQKCPGAGAVRKEPWEGKIVAGAVGVAAAALTDGVLGLYGVKGIRVAILAMAVGLGVYILLRMVMKK